MIITRKSSAFTLPLPTLVLNITSLEIIPHSSTWVSLLLPTSPGHLTSALYVLSQEKYRSNLLPSLPPPFYLYTSNTLQCTSSHPSYILLHCMGTHSFSCKLKSLERVQHFTLTLCTHSWSSDYTSLLSTLKLSTLSNRCDQAKLTLL